MIIAGSAAHHLQQAKAEEENPEQSGERNQQTMDNLFVPCDANGPLGQRKARSAYADGLQRVRLRERFAVPSLAAALRPTCARFDYLPILACTARGVTPILPKPFPPALPCRDQT